MDYISIHGQIDEHHRLSAIVPESIPPGPVTVSITTVPEEDDAGMSWSNGIADQWANELTDDRQDIYSITDGEAVDPV